MEKSSDAGANHNRAMEITSQNWRMRLLRKTEVLVTIRTPTDKEILEAVRNKKKILEGLMQDESKLTS